MPRHDAYSASFSTVMRRLITAVLAIVFALTLAASAQAATTYVNLGFDDGLLSQYAHRSLLEQHGAHATYFINSGTVGRADTMSWGQIADLAAAGHEIGGHTIDHARLTSLTQADMQHQVCDDRTALLSHGLDVRNFAYPFGAWNATTKTVVAGCGYDSARTTGGTDYPDPCCVFAETIPPKNAYTLRAIQPRYDTTIDVYQDIVNRARLSGGGWVNVVLHGVCTDPCLSPGDYDTPASRLDEFLDWLGTLPDVQIRTTGQLLASATDSAPPSVSLSAPAAGATVTGTTTLAASASDDSGVARVEFLVDGVLVGSDTSAPYTTAWSSASAGDTATIAARATDKAGNVVASAPVTVTVTHPDATPPTVTLTAPASGAEVTGTVALAADASDNVGVDHVDFLVGGSVVGTDASAPYGLDWDSSSAGSSATIAARAVDAAGNATTSAAATVTVKHASPTVVTFGFDDGIASQYDHRGLFAAHGANATYFINSGNVGKPGYVTWAQIADLAAAGNEIGGHTIDHVRLTTATAAEQQRQVCDDRTALIQHGFDVRNFAYPFGAWDAAVKGVVAGCGYATARTTGGTDFPDPCCVFAETIPPKNAYTLRAYQPRLSSPLSEYQDLITRARYSGGGWVNLVLHGVCDDPCSAGESEYSISATTLSQLLDWIDAQPGVSVETTREALGQAPDTTAPTVALTAPANGATVARVATLTASASDNIGVARVDFIVDGNVVGSDTTAPYSYAYDFTPAGALSVIAARAVDSSGNATTSATRTLHVTDVQPPVVTLIAPAAGETVAGTYTVQGAATDNVGIRRVELIVNNTVVATDTTAPYSFSWNSSTYGSSVAMALRAKDIGNNVTTTPTRTVLVWHPDTQPPTVSLTAPANLGTVKGTVTMAANAADNVGVASVDFLVNGLVVGTDTTAPYSVPWNTALTAGSVGTLNARARDAAGNARTSATRTVTIVH